MNSFAPMEPCLLDRILSDNSSFPINTTNPPLQKKRLLQPRKEMLKDPVIQNVLTDFLTGDCTQANVPIPQTSDLEIRVNYLEQFFSLVYLAGHGDGISMYRVGSFSKNTRSLYEEALNEKVIHPIFAHSYFNKGLLLPKGHTEYLSLKIDLGNDVPERKSENSLLALVNQIPSYFTYWFPAIFSESQIANTTLFHAFAQNGMAVILCGCFDSNNQFNSHTAAVFNLHG